MSAVDGAFLFVIGMALGGFLVAYVALFHRQRFDGQIRELEELSARMPAMLAETKKLHQQLTQAREALNYVDSWVFDGFDQLCREYDALCTIESDVRVRVWQNIYNHQPQLSLDKYGKISAENRRIRKQFEKLLETLRVRSEWIAAASNDDAGAVVDQPPGVVVS